MFNYSILTNIFFSKGKIKIKDINNNDYFFSEIYIDEKEKKIMPGHFSVRSGIGPTLKLDRAI